MKPLSERDQETAEVLAFALGDAMCTAIPVLLTQPPEAVLSVALPIPQSLVRYERRATKNRKHARRYRKLCRETRELLRTEDSAIVRNDVLAGTVAFDPGGWHVQLAPGIGSEHLDVP